MKINVVILTAVVFALFFACSKGQEEIILDPETQALVDILEEVLYPLPTDPLTWSNEELQFLDPLAEKSVIALGEATHGTAEFFKAKHRIFQYLVENHGYRVFAFEADFGESLLINEAVLEGRAGDIEELMKSHMHFWTWKTEEVKDLLEWMCQYNQDKAEAEKIHYMGFDCQFNTHHPQMVLDYLESTQAPFYNFADSILKDSRALTEDKFPSYTSLAFSNYVKELEAILDSMLHYESILIQQSSEKEFQLHTQIMRIVRQVSEVVYANQSGDNSINYRDKYMAENTAWLLEYLDGMKAVVWAHNWHISNYPYGNTGTMGYYLYQELVGEYGMVGFLFSQGTFTAVGREGEQYTGLGTQTLDTIPLDNSLNALLSYTQIPAFSVRIGDLLWQPEWLSLLNSNNLMYFQMGAVYNYKPENYYSVFNPDFFDWLIYFDQSTATVPLE